MLFDKYESLNDEGSDLFIKVKEAVSGVMKDFVDSGHTGREVLQVAVSAVEEVGLNIILDKAFTIARNN